MSKIKYIILSLSSILLPELAEVKVGETVTVRSGNNYAPLLAQRLGDLPAAGRGEGGEVLKI